MSIEEINRIRKGVARNGFVIYALGVIDKMEKDGRYGISQGYRSSVKSLVQFTKSERIPFQMFRFALLEEYENWLIQQGCCENTAHYYLRNLRAIYNRAVKEKVIRPRTNPFSGICFRRTLITGTDQKVQNDQPVYLACLVGWS